MTAETCCVRKKESCPEKEKRSAKVLLHAIQSFNEDQWMDFKDLTYLTECDMGWLIKLLEGKAE